MSLTCGGCDAGGCAATALAKIYAGRRGVDEGSPIMAADEPRDDEPSGPAADARRPRLAGRRRDDARHRSPTRPAQQPRGDTVEQPPADPWAEDTEVRPAGSVPPSFPDSLGEPEPAEAGRAAVGPTGTGILPTVAGAEPRPAGRPGPRSARRTSATRSAVDEEWAEPGRSVRWCRSWSRS